MSSYLRNYYDKVVETPEYIYTIGDIPIALCAHMDTVWEDYKGGRKHLYYDKQKECMWCPEGAGFDDKVGVFLIIKIVESGLRPHIILSTGEEIGGIGANELSRLDCPFENLKYCIELDRMGANDCVFYSCNNPEFEQYVESFGFKTEWGTFTDICHYCPSWGIAGVNLSVGYFQEHTTNERLFVRSMLKTLSKVKKMLNAKTIPYFEYIPAYRTKFSKYFGNKLDDYPREDYDKYDDYYYYGPYAYYGYDDDDDENIKWGHYLRYKKCSICGKTVDEDETLPFTLKDGSAGYVCNDCLSNEKVDWCDFCHEAYECEPEATEHICPKCKELIYGKFDDIPIV